MVVVVGWVVSVVVGAAAVVVVAATVVVVTGALVVVVAGGAVVVTGGWVVVAGGWVVVTGVVSGVVPGVVDVGRVVAVGAVVAVGPVPRFGDVVGDELAAVTGRGAATAALDGADVLGGGDAFAWPPCDWSTICRICAAICAAVGSVDDVAADCSGLWLGGKATAALGAVVVEEDAAPCRGVEELLNARPSGMPIKMISPATAR